MCSTGGWSRGMGQGGGEGVGRGGGSVSLAFVPPELKQVIRSSSNKLRPKTTSSHVSYRDIVACWVAGNYLINDGATWYIEIIEISRTVSLELALKLK